MEKIGTRIERLRKQKDYSLRELGDLVDVSHETIRLWEGGQKDNISLENIRKLSKALDTTEDYLINGEMGDEPGHNKGADKNQLSTQNLNFMITMPKEVWNEFMAQNSFNREITRGHVEILKNFSIEPEKFLKKKVG